MRVVASREAEYRRLARECQEMARTVTTENARAALIEMAQVWQRLAEEQEASAASAQQQQQIQPKKGNGNGKA